MALSINGTTGISGVDGSASAPAIVGSDSNTGLSFGSDTIAFNTGGSERCRVDSGGRLLIGTTSTSGTSASGDDIIIGSIGDSTSRGITFATTNDGTIRWADAGDNAMGRIQYLNGTDIMSFHTTNEQRMTINQQGRVQIGTVNTAISSEMFLATQSSDSNYVAVFNRTTDTDSSFRNHVGFAKSGSIVGSIKCKSNQTQYNTSSDYRLKENISDVTDGIAKVKLLQPRKFNFKDEKGNFYDGFIAHEIQEVIPDCTSGTKDQVDEDGKPIYQGMDYGRITPVLTAAIKDLIAKVETLETKVAALEAA